MDWSKAIKDAASLREDIGTDQASLARAGAVANAVQLQLEAVGQSADHGIQQCQQEMQIVQQVVQQLSGAATTVPQATPSDLETQGVLPMPDYPTAPTEPTALTAPGCSNAAMVGPLQYSAGTLPSQGVLHYQGPPNALAACPQGIIPGPERAAWPGMPCASAISRLVPGHSALGVTPAQTNVPLPVGCLHTGDALAPRMAIADAGAVEHTTLQGLAATGQGFRDACGPLPGRSQTESAASDRESSIVALASLRDSVARPATVLPNQSSVAPRTMACAGSIADIRPARTQAVEAPLAAPAATTLPGNDASPGASAATQQVAADAAGGEARPAPGDDGHEPKRRRY